MACTALALTWSFVGAAVAAEPIVESNVTLRLSSGELRAEVFEPSARGARPIVVVLHGAGGTLFDGPEMRRVARYLAGAGNAVYVLHYFETTGTFFARDASMQTHFGTWLRAVRESIPALQKLRASEAPVGIYGYSLGGFLALLAASDNPRVGAVVEHAGGVWNGKMERVGRMPPVLMVHGLQDGRVPFPKYAEPLLPVLRRRAASVQTRFFPAEAHVFSQRAMAEVRPAAAKFFAQHLTRR